MTHKAGFVNIIGNPNAGKSTIVNRLMGFDLNATNPKAQTTRHRIFAILSEEDYQIVISDTPGVLEPKYKLQESMLAAVEQALQDADVFLLVFTPKEKELNNPVILEKIKKSGKPVILCINKIDQSKQEEIIEAAAYWQEQLPEAKILPISALENFQISTIQELIVEELPEHPAYYSKDEVSDRSTRFFIEEYIRETALELYEKEIPYAIEVIVSSYKKTAKNTHIEAQIIVERDTQKGIIIGHQGKMIKRLGTLSRKKIEAFIDDAVFLELHVKVDKNWRKEDRKLKKYGYLRS